MRKFIFLKITFLFFCSLSYSQTIEDFKKLGLSFSQLRSCEEKKELVLTNRITGKTKKIKEKKRASIQIKGDSLATEMAIIDILNDTILVALFTPQLINQTIEPRFSEYKLIPIKEIETIYYYRFIHDKRAFWSSFVMIIAGINMAILPTVMPLLIGNADKIYSQPQFPFIVAGGVALFIIGKKIQKELAPKKYNLKADWSYFVKKD